MNISKIFMNILDGTSDLISRLSPKLGSISKKTLLRNILYYFFILIFMLIYSIDFAQMPKNGPVQLRIKIVDERGVPVKGIRVFANISIFSGIPFKETSDSKMFEVNDFFSLDVSCKSITINFAGQNYREKRLVIMYDPSTDEIPKPKILKNGVHLYEKTIVLQKNGNIGEMQVYDEFLGFNPQKGYKVINISALAKKGQRGKTIRLQNVVDPDQMTNIPRIYLRTIPRKEVITEKPGERVRRPLDKDVCLVLDDRTTNCGFILVDYKSAVDRAFIKYKTEGKPEMRLEKFVEEKTDSISDDLLFDMTEAPESGYQKEIKIPDKYWENKYPICFYMRMNGLYGKGCLWGIEPMSYNDSTKTVSSRIKFALELDGSRNVTSKEFSSWF